MKREIRGKDRERLAQEIAGLTGLSIKELKDRVHIWLAERGEGDAGINMSFAMAQVVGRRYSAVFGFENEADASKAATLIKRATARGNK
jgi:hypothetical protein